MKRRDFYITYYDRTNRTFSDKTVWGKEERERAWRKGQYLTSKLERKIFIVVQYLVLLSCWIPMCFDCGAWVVVPIALLLFLLHSFITDFSIIKIELLYLIYRNNNIYCSLLYDIFLGNLTDFLQELKRSSKKKVTGFVFGGGGKFYGKYYAVCRNKHNNIALCFKRDRVIVTVNKKKHRIKDVLLTKGQLITEIAAIINSSE